jgi:hypothetical protein
MVASNESKNTGPMSFKKQMVIPMLFLYSRLSLLSLLALVVLAVAPPCARAQASTSASRSADLSVFGGYQITDPAYGPDRDDGGVVGVDFTKYIRFPVQPSLELRANFDSGTFANEDSYLFGLRGMVPLGFLQPYVEFLVGPGNVHYPQNSYYRGDNSIVYNYGGGVDIPFLRNFALKLDVQGQHWNTGEIHFAPVLGTVGVTYHIPFRPHNNQATIVP